MSMTLRPNQARIALLLACSLSCTSAPAPVGSTRGPAERPVTPASVAAAHVSVGGRVRATSEAPVQAPAENRIVPVSVFVLLDLSRSMCIPGGACESFDRARELIRDEILPAISFGDRIACFAIRDAPPREALFGGRAREQAPVLSAASDATLDVILRRETRCRTGLDAARLLDEVVEKTSVLDSRRSGWTSVLDELEPEATLTDIIAALDVVASIVDDEWESSSDHETWVVIVSDFEHEGDRGELAIPGALSDARVVLVIPESRQPDHEWWERVIGADCLWMSLHSALNDGVGLAPGRANRLHVGEECRPF